MDTNTQTCTHTYIHTCINVHIFVMFGKVTLCDFKKSQKMCTVTVHIKMLPRIKIKKKKFDNSK